MNCYIVKKIKKQEEKILKDIQSQQDNRQVEIQKVGVRNVHIPMIIPEKSGSVQNVSAEVELNASLSSEMRGTHMSRFMEILNKYSKITLSYESLKNILSETKEALKSSSVSMNIKFRYYIEKQAPISQKKGLLIIFVVLKFHLIKILKQFFILKFQ